MTQDLNTLRKWAESAYARWRAAGCDGLRARDGETDEYCTRLKAEVDRAEHAVRLARGQQLTEQQRG
jgi:hypothetical protein